MYLELHQQLLEDLLLIIQKKLKLSLLYGGKQHQKTHISVSIIHYIA